MGHRGGDMAAVGAVDVFDLRRSSDRPEESPRPLGPWLRGLATVALIVLVAFQALVAWVPFQLDAPGRYDNGVAQRSDGSLEVTGPRALAASEPPEALASAGDATTVQLDLDVTPADGSQEGPARIFAYSRDYQHANLMVGQERADLLVRLRRAGADDMGEPSLRVHDVFEEGQRLTATVVVGEGGAGVAVEGHEPVTTGMDAPAVPMWDDSHLITIGDDPRGQRVWQGVVHEATLSVDGQPTDYLAPGALEMPDRVWYAPTHRWRDSLVPDPSAMRRSVLHLMAFVPIGALLLARRRAVARPASVIAPAVAISVTLQLGKLVVDGRHASLLDIGAHSLGALAGAVAIAAVLRRWRPPEDARARGQSRRRRLTP